MSIKVMTMVFEAHFGSVSLKAVALKMADHAADDGGSVYPAKETVAAATEVSIATVKRSVKLFVQKGLLWVVREGGKGPRDPTVYKFNLELLRGMCGGSTPLSALPDYEPAVVPASPVEDIGTDAKGVTVNPLRTKKGGHGEPLRGVARGSPDHAKGFTGAQKGVHSLTPKPSRTVSEPCSRAREGAAPPNHAQPDDDRLRAALINAAGDAVAKGAKGLGKLAVIRKWLDEGVELNTVLEAVRERAKTMDPGSLRSWRFMDGPIGDHVQDRNPTQASRPVEVRKPSDPADRTARQWRFWVSQWLNGSDWHPDSGPEPGEPGCLVPDDVIAGVLSSKGNDAIERRKKAT